MTDDIEALAAEAFDEALDEPQEIKEVEEKPEDERPAPGYMTKEEWIAAGKDPGKWMDPVKFQIRGEFIEELKGVRAELARERREFDNRIENLALLHQTALENERARLKAERKEAILVADSDAVERLDGQLDDVNKRLELVKEQPKQQVQKTPEILEWEAKNPWIFDNDDPKAQLGIAVYKRCISAGWPVAAALLKVDEEVAKMPSQSKPKPNIAEATRSNGQKQTSAAVTMDSLTEDERAVWRSGVFSDQKQFLQAVADDRRARKHG